jgi:hypothetical protein
LLDGAEVQEVREFESVSPSISSTPSSPRSRSSRILRLAPAVAFAALALAALSAGIARGDNRASASVILEELANDAAHKDATAAIVQRGRDALERATRMRAAGDEAHAQLADGLALEEAETARDLVRALEVERMADDARRGATDAGAVGERERALLEEGIARNGRLKAELEELNKSRRAPTKTDKTAASDAGVKSVPGGGGVKSDGGAR